MVGHVSHSLTAEITQRGKYGSISRSFVSVLLLCLVHKDMPLDKEGVIDLYGSRGDRRLDFVTK